MPRGSDKLFRKNQVSSKNGDKRFKGAFKAEVSGLYLTFAVQSCSVGLVLSLLLMPAWDIG